MAAAQFDDSYYRFGFDEFARAYGAPIEEYKVLRKKHPEKFSSFELGYIAKRLGFDALSLFEAKVVLKSPYSDGVVNNV